jgi:hypothetical protein
MQGLGIMSLFPLQGIEFDRLRITGSTDRNQRICLRALIETGATVRSSFVC